MNLRKAVVKFGDQIAGYLSEIENGCRFVYDKNYLTHGQPISVAFPLQSEPFESEELFNFFKGLLPEGAYLEIVGRTLKVDTNDLFGVLVATTSCTIGSVYLVKAK